MKIFVRVLVLCLIPCSLWPQIRPDSTATMIFTGDFSLAHAFERASRNKAIDVFARWEQIGAYDGMMVNLENAVTRSVDSVDKEFVFKMKPEFLSQLKKGKILIVNCGNNHTADFGIEGILETIRDLDSAGIGHVGIGRTLAEARKAVVLKIKGIRIGFLGYGGSEEYIASSASAGTASRSERLILSDVKKPRPQVDAVVVNLHWGEELATEPDQGQINMAHHIIDGGADLIIGHHPHVLQGIERYKGKVIAYSLGNFVFGGNSSCINSKTAVIKVQFTKESMTVQALPVCIRNWQPVNADSASASEIIDQLMERSKPFLESISYIR